MRFPFFKPAPPGPIARGVSRIELALESLTQRIVKMAVDTSKLTAIMTQIQADQATIATDQAKNASDIVALLTALQAAQGGGTEPAAAQAAIDQAVTVLTPIAANMEASAAALEASNAAMDAALNPPAAPAMPEPVAGAAPTA